MKTQRLFALSILCLVCAGTEEATALEITHNGGDVFISGGFEGDNLDALPSNTSLGTWVHRSGDVAKESVLGPASSGPGAAVSSQYALVGLNADNGSGAGISATLGALTSGVVEATFKLYLDEVRSGSGLHLNFNYAGAADFAFGDRATWVGVAHPDDVVGALGVASAGAGAATVAFYDGSAWNAVTSSGTGMSIPYNSWNDMTVSIDLDADTHSISVNGLASDTMGGALDVAVSGFNLMTNFDSGLEGNAYIDGAGTPQTPGDVNGDGDVDLEDYEIIRLNYGMTDAGKSDGDLTGGGDVNLFDFKLWKSLRTDGGPAVSIPEPISLVLLAMGVVTIGAISGRRTGR